MIAHARADYFLKHFVGASIKSVADRSNSKLGFFGNGEAPSQYMYLFAKSNTDFLIPTPRSIATQQ